MKEKFIKFFSDHSEKFFYVPIPKKLNGQKKFLDNFSYPKKKVVSLKKTSFEKFSIYVPELVGFQTMLIIDQKNIL